MGMVGNAKVFCSGSTGLFPSSHSSGSTELFAQSKAVKRIGTFYQEEHCGGSTPPMYCQSNAFSDAYAAAEDDDYPSTGTELAEETVDSTRLGSKSCLKRGASKEKPNISWDLDGAMQQFEEAHYQCSTYEKYYKDHATAKRGGLRRAKKKPILRGILKKDAHAAERKASEGMWENPGKRGHGVPLRC